MPTIRGENEGGIEIFYEEQGAGEAVVTIGGLTSTVETWGLQVPTLAAHYRVVSPDNRGSGRTRLERDDAVRTPARFAGDVRVLLDGLGLERVHLVGASMGGMIAQEFALAHPERLRSLVLACTTCGGTHAAPPSPEVVARMVRGSAPEASEEERRAGLATVFHPESFEKRPEAVAFYEGTKKQWPHSAEEIGRRVAGIARFDTWERLPRLAVPTLVLTGSDDILVPPENSRILAERVPDAQRVVIAEGGHVFFCEQAEATNRALLAFLGRQASNR